MIGLITPGTKQTGKRSAGKPHAAFDVAGAGNVTMVAGLQSLAKATELPPAPTVRAPALDPTGELVTGNPVRWGEGHPALRLGADLDHDPEHPLLRRGVLNTNAR